MTSRLSQEPASSPVGEAIQALERLIEAPDFEQAFTYRARQSIRAATRALHWHPYRQTG